MNKIAQALTSRTFWTTVVMLVINFIPNLSVSQATKDLINGILGLLVIYFHLNQSQPYDK